MTRTMIALVSTVALVVASSTTVPAQGKKGSTPKPQHVSSKGGTTKVSSPKSTNAGPKTSAPRTTTGSPASKAPKTTTARATGKTNTTSSPATRTARTDAKTRTKSPTVEANSTARTAKADTTVTSRERTSTTPTPTTTTTPPTGDTETPPVVLTRVQERLQKNAKLAERLEGRLPRGTDLMEAADGFKNLGQFVAAVNVSGNLGLDFEKLKIAMVDDGKSLGQAIQFVKTDVENPTVVAQRAESDALTLIKQTENTTTTTTSATSPTTTTRTTTPRTTSKDKPKRAGS